MTHPEYLEAHLTASTRAFARINALLGQDKTTEAKTAVEEARTAFDALWEQRRQTAALEVAP